MSRPIFTVRGRVAFRDDVDAGGVFVAIVDDDPDLDDLLGVGTTRADGTFRLSFTREAFNQEPGEAEETPDLYVILSTLDTGKPAPIIRKEIGKLAFANPQREEDLGTLELPLKKGELGFASFGLRAAPGRGKIARRVHLDDALVEVAAREVAPMVERVTGWSGLLDGIRIEIIDDYLAFRRETTVRLLERADFGEKELAILGVLASSCQGSSLAEWDPPGNVIGLNRGLLEAQSFDFLKLTIGHELVHVGQSRCDAALRAKLDRLRREHYEAILAGKVRSIGEERDIHRILSNLEGYAAYVEETFLRAFYTHADELSIVTSRADNHFRQLLARRVVSFEMPDQSPLEVLERALSTKQMQYDAGKSAYAARAMEAKNGDPARFDPTLTPAFVSGLEDLLDMLSQAVR